MFFDKLITSGNKENNKMSESATFIRHYITIYLLILAVERLYRILRSSLRGKRKGEQKESFTGGRIIRPDGYFVGPSGRLPFVWLCVSSIKRGARRIIPLDQLSFAILFERRIKRSSSFAWYKRRITRWTHSLQICLVPRPHYYARPMRFGSRGPSKFLLRYVTEMNWPRRPGKTPYSATWQLSTHLSAIALATSSFALANSRRSLTY